MGSSFVDVKADKPNNAPNQMLGGWTTWVNGQDQIVQLGNYYYSSFRVVSIDEIKIQPLKDYHDSYSNYIALRVEGKVLWELNWKLLAKKKKYTGGNNILRI